MDKCPRCGEMTLRREPAMYFCVTLHCECGAFGWARTQEPFTSCIFEAGDKPAWIRNPGGEWTEAKKKEPTDDAR